VISYLLDTHILVWWLLGVNRLSSVQLHVLKELEAKNEPAGLSAISLRESAKLIQDGKLEVDASLDEWLESIEFHPLLTILPLSTKIAAESIRLGDDFHRDPADQIIVATARCHRLTLITADERIRKWGKVNLV
jgi:PIN domain nuclease of toxin-antitoxin system